MPQKPPAKKARQTRNISGLRNQKRAPSVVSESSGHPTPAISLAPSPGGDESDPEDDDDDLDLLIQFDSLKTNLAYEEEHPDYIEEEEDEELLEWEGFGREDLVEVMVDMFEAIDDDPGDLNWLPTNLKVMRERKRKQRQKGKPKGRYSLTFMPLKQLHFPLTHSRLLK
jgi:hypothetical protein